MAGVKDVVLIKAIKFISDFKSLSSSPSEVAKTLEKSGYHKNLLYNWEAKAKANGGELRVSKDAFLHLCDISGLCVNDYFISYGKNSRAKKTPNPTATQTITYVKKDGYSVTTYAKKPQAKSSAAPEVASPETASDREQFAFRLTSFRNHMQVYRRLLGLTTAVMRDDYKIDNYMDIEDGKVVLSIATYFTLSKIFMDKYNALPNSAIKTAFADLAADYKDIFVDVIYFGDIKKNNKRKA